MTAQRLIKTAAFAALALGAAHLTACATPYQELGGLRGGVKAVQITANIAQVTARGTAATDPDKVQRYALRKAAETTVAAGYDLFEVVADVDRSRSGQAGAAYTTGGLGGFPALALTMPFVKPGQTFLIRMSRGSLPDSAGPTVFDARQVIQHIGGRYGV
jgi:hypothetical protein